jgi:DNA helicase HerA-like ATPase
MDLSNIRIREHFGLISHDASTTKFSFLVSPPKNRDSVAKEDYVIVDHPTLGEMCPVLAQIKEITSYQEASGSTTGGDRMGKMFAVTEIVGYVDLREKDRPMRRLLVPPIPGSRVHVPLMNFLEDTFNRTAKGEPFTQPIPFGKPADSSAHDGRAQSHINCFIDANELVTRHTLIAAMTGAGKTRAAKALIQELPSKNDTPVVIIDQAGEYTGLNPSKAQVVILAAKPEKAAKRVEDKQTQVIALTEENQKSKLSKEIKQSQITILNGQGLTVEERRIFYADCLKALWKNLADETIRPFFLLVEEAENLKGETLDQIITEGRKNGVGICLLSIHPAELGGIVLSQISNEIVGKTTYKDDIEILANMTNVNPSVIQQLAVGEWIINGANRAGPMKVQLEQ